MPHRPGEQQALHLHVLAGDGNQGYVAESFKDRLPKADIGRSCVRFKRRDDVDLDAVRELVRAGAAIDGTVQSS